MKVRTFLNVAGAFFSTVGIIVPVAIYARPRDGYRVPPILDMGGNYSNVSRPAKMQLSLVLRVLGGMEQSGVERLNAAQARSGLAMIEPWRQRPHLTDEAALALSQKLTTILSETQREKFEQGLSGYGGFSGYHGSGIYYDEKQRLLVDTFRQIYNPFFPPKRYKEFQYLSPEAQERFKVRYVERQLLLQAWQRRAYPQKTGSRRLAAKSGG